LQLEPHYIVTIVYDEGIGFCLLEKEKHEKVRSVCNGTGRLEEIICYVCNITGYVVIESAINKLMRLLIHSTRYDILIQMLVIDNMPVINFQSNNISRHLLDIIQDYYQILFIEESVINTSEKIDKYIHLLKSDKAKRYLLQIVNSETIK
jgi:hypothetical protein